jgi:hypothetical protein
MTMTTNEQDFLSIIVWLASTRSPDDRAGAALQRLLAQMPKPAEEIDTRPDGVRRRESIEAAKAPLPKVTLPPVVPDSVARKEFLEAMKRPPSVRRS